MDDSGRARAVAVVRGRIADAYLLPLPGGGVAPASLRAQLRISFRSLQSLFCAAIVASEVLLERRYPAHRYVRH